MKHKKFYQSAAPGTSRKDYVWHNSQWILKDEYVRLTGRTVAAKQPRIENRFDIQPKRQPPKQAVILDADFADVETRKERLLS